jgi:hypothetical protein
MLRNDHRLMIEQNVDGETHWTTIRLIDKLESKDGKSVTGSWKHTSDSYNDKEILFTSDNPQYLYWEWNGGPQGGDFSIGSKMGRASHKAGEDEIFQVLITLDFAKRMADGAFKLASERGNGSGKLKYNVNPHFKAGEITWTVVRYER